jgi:hypothetical protein
MSSNLLSLNPTKTEFLVFGTTQQLAKLDNPTLTIDQSTILTPAPSARNLGFFLDSHLNFTAQISSLSRICSYHLRDFRRIRSILDFSTASVIATSLVHSKLDYCNSLFLGLPDYQIQKLQVIQNNLARAVTSKRKFDHITPSLKSLRWLKIEQRIDFKIISLTYSALQFGQPVYLRNLLSIEPSHRTRSSSFVTLHRPSVPSGTPVIINRSFYYTAPSLWNKLPDHLRLPATSSSSSGPVLALSRRQFLAQLKTHLFSKSYPPDPP